MHIYTKKEHTATCLYHLQVKSEQKGNITDEYQGNNWCTASSHHLWYQQHDIAVSDPESNICYGVNVPEVVPKIRPV